MKDERECLLQLYLGVFMCVSFSLHSIKVHWAPLYGGNAYKRPFLLLLQYLCVWVGGCPNYGFSLLHCIPLDNWQKSGYLKTFFQRNKFADWVNETKMLQLYIFVEKKNLSTGYLSTVIVLGKKIGILSTVIVGMLNLAEGERNIYFIKIKTSTFILTF